jgi:hypothetical protein
MNKQQFLKLLRDFGDDWNNKELGIMRQEILFDLYDLLRNEGVINIEEDYDTKTRA